MFPIKSSDTYIKDNGKRSTIGAEIGGGGGSALPEYSEADAGKVLKVADDGSLEWDEEEAGGVVVLSGTTDPTTLTGENGNIFIKYTDYTSIPGYTPVEYIGIENTPGPFINTGVDISADSYFELCAQRTGEWSNDQILIGHWVSLKDFLLGYYNGYIFYVGGSGTRSFTLDTEKHIFKAFSDGLYLDDTKVGDPNWNNFDPDCDIYLFRDQRSGKEIRNVKFYYLKMYSNNQLVRDFIPVKRNSDNALGIYDLINNTFYPNEGTGTFIGGNEKTGKPITGTYLKVNGVWQPLIGSDVDDISGL